MAIVVVCAPVSGGQSPQAPPRLQAPWLPGTLTGRVVAGDSGEPVRAAEISAVPVGSPGTAAASVSDLEGRFELKNLEAGSYRLSAAKPGFVRTVLGARSPTDEGRLLQVTAGRILNVSDFRIARAGVITGRVLDEFGDPVVDARVIAEVPVPPAPGYAAGTAIASTDDRGEYRLAGLGAGDYFVQARAEVQLVGSASYREAMDRALLKSLRYRPTFFPNRTSFKEAERITVRAGEQLSNIDIVLSPARYFSIAGVGRDAEGRPAKLASLTLAPLNGDRMPGERAPQAQGDASMSIVQVDGTFRLSSVLPGDYSLSMLRRGDGGTVEIAATGISVGEADVRNVVLTLGPAGVIRGRVELDPPTAAFRMSQLRVAARPSPRGMPSIRTSDMVIGDDGAFALDGLLGPTTLGVQGLPVGWQLKSVLVGNRDMTGDDLVVGPGVVTGDVRIVITDRLAAVSGVVVDSRGGRVDDYAVILFAEDRRRWADLPSGAVHLARPGADGAFAIAQMLPGPYFVIAVDAAEPGQLREPAFLEGLWPLATHVNLPANAPQHLSLKLAPVP